VGLVVVSVNIRLVMKFKVSSDNFLDQLSDDQLLTELDMFSNSAINIIIIKFKIGSHCLFCYRASCNE
jgi:hypothetical protein